MPRISATAVDEVATKRLEAMNRERWGRPRRWVCLGVLKSKGQGLHFQGNENHDKRNGVRCGIF